jgi:NADH-ubiquinone oxidoreductase chain 5
MKLNLFIILIVAIPVLGSFVAGFLGRKIGIRGSQFITCFSLIISSLLISYAFYEIVLCGGEAVNLNLGS